jgi:hypothetical protein
MAFEPVLLKNVQKPGSARIDVYEQGGGYQALRKALGTMTPTRSSEKSEVGLGDAAALGSRPG